MVDSSRSIPLVLLLGGTAVAAPQNFTLESANSKGVSADREVGTGVMTPDARFVVFDSDGTNLGSGDANFAYDVFLRDRADGSLEWISVTSDEIPVNDDSGDASISDDGRWIAFRSWATNITPDATTWPQIYMRDRQLGTTTLISRNSSGMPANAAVSEPSLTPDASSMAFSGGATNLVAGDTNGEDDVFVRDFTAGTTVRVSVSSTGTQANSWCVRPALSADARVVVFVSPASTLVAGDSFFATDVFARDVVAGTTERISIALNGQAGNHFSGDDQPAISADGRFVAFDSRASDLVLGDTNGAMDVFVRDRLLGTTERVSVTWDGVQATGNSSGNRDTPISADGRFVLFGSSASNLVVGDTNASYDIFVRDRLLATTTRVNVKSDGQQAISGGSCHSISPDGRYVLINASTAELVVGDVNSPIGDVLVGDTQMVATPITGYCTAKIASLGCIPYIGVNGAPLASGNDAFFVWASDVLASKSGLLFWGRAPAALPFGGGTLCVAPPIERTFVQNSGTAAQCGGTYSFHFRQSYMASEGVAAGDTLYAQYWSRDPGFAPPNNIGLTAAIRFTVVP